MSVTFSEPSGLFRAEEVDRGAVALAESTLTANYNLKPATTLLNSAPNELRALANQCSDNNQGLSTCALDLRLALSDLAHALQDIDGRAVVVQTYYLVKNERLSGIRERLERLSSESYYAERQINLVQCLQSACGSLQEIWQVILGEGSDKVRANWGQSQARYELSGALLQALRQTLMQQCDLISAAIVHFSREAQAA